MEESGYESGLFPLINQGFDHINAHGGCQHSQQDQFVPVIIPQRRVRVISETLVYNFSASVNEITVHIASQSGPEKRTVQAGIEYPPLTLSAARHLDFRQQSLPSFRGLFSYLREALSQHFLL